MVILVDSSASRVQQWLKIHFVGISKSTAGITTRSKAKIAPDQWTLVPLPGKVFLLFPIWWFQKLMSACVFVFCILWHTGHEIYANKLIHGLTILARQWVINWSLYQSLCFHLCFSICLRLFWCIFLNQSVFLLADM